MNKALATFLLVLIIAFNRSSAVEGKQTKELAECVVLAHCVRVDLKVGAMEEAFKKSLDIVMTTPRTKIIEQSDSYIHAEATTKWLRYTDDLEIKIVPDQSVLQIRSESRVGVGDMGVNQKRVDDFANRLLN